MTDSKSTAVSVDELKSRFSGEIILPEGNTYETARNTLFSKGSPVIVLRPENNKDVALAIKYARDNSLKLSIRSGGHSVAGFGTNKSGAVVDMSLMNEVRLLDKEKHLVRLGAGAKWGDVGKALEKHHLAISSGDTITVGVGGLTLGGGVGWMVRKYGLAIDSLVAAEVVTADSKTLRVSETENTDLFWALRGGGGNFGIVTAFEFVAHPVGNVFAGHIVYGLDNLPELIAGWRDGMRDAPEELTTMLVTLPSFMGMPPSAIVMCCYAGDDKMKADKALKPFRKLGKVLNDDVKEKHYYEVLQEAHPPAMRNIVKNGFVQHFSDELVQTIAGLYKDNTGPIFQIRWLGGAMKRAKTDATAFAHRDAETLIISPAFVPFDAPEADVQKALEPWQKVVPFIKGGYIGFFSELDEDIATMYPSAAYKRLVKVKKTYDPDNIFNQNFNIKPALE
jgi:FAD/FMN-containing dehydrogenase